jgi:hypothetical protein
LTVPTTPAPLISSTQNGGQITLSWPAIYSGYALQMKTNLTDASWTTVYAGTNTTFSITPGSGQPSAFYRLILP